MNGNPVDQKQLQKKYDLVYKKAEGWVRENKLLCSLIARLSVNSQSDNVNLSEYLMQDLVPVARFFALEKDQRMALKQMVQFTFLCQAIQLKPDPEDPYCFAQTEWLLKDSETLSVIGIAMRLSLERLDGQGPQALQYELMPALALAYRCLLVMAEQKQRYSEVDVIASACAHALAPYFPDEQVTKIIQLLAEADFTHEIHWLDVVQLRADMKVTEDVRNESGLLLVAKDMLLTEALVASLINYDREQGIKQKIPVCALL